MSLDSELVNAIAEVCREMGQPERVEKRLVAWLKECSEKQLTVAQDTEHLELLRQAIVVNDADL